jgi:hypothetical protein
MKIQSASWGALLALGMLQCSPSVQAQPDNQPASPGVDAPAPPSDTNTPPGNPPGPASSPTDARDALKKQAGDVDQAALLKDTLTKQDRSYSLLKAGRMAVNYDLNYQYIGSEAIVTGLDTTGSIDLFKVENTRAHTITNSISLDYGLLDNVTLTGTLPFVSKFTQSDSFSGIANAPGDLLFGMRYQPMAQRLGGSTVTLTTTLSMPTGRSPFKTTLGENLSTGAGYPSLTLGVNGSQVLDPVALFGSASFVYSGTASGLHQAFPDESTLTAVHPGKGVGFGAGFTYALSYNISTSVSFQELVTTASRLNYVTAAGLATDKLTAQQVSALMNFGLSVRLNPKTSINLSAAIGLTTDSPDFSLGLNVPLTFSMF